MLVFLVMSVSCGGMPAADGSAQGWGEDGFLVVGANGSGRIVDRAEVGPSSESYFAVEWSIGRFSPPDIWLSPVVSPSVISLLADDYELCDVDDARGFDYTDYFLSEAAGEDDVAILFNANLDSHLAILIEDVTPTGATPEEHFAGAPFATVDVSWYLQPDGSGDFSKLCD